MKRVFLGMILLVLTCMPVYGAHDGGDCGPPELRYTVTVTHYCPCVRCCGKADGITKSGVKARAGVTVAAWRGLVIGQRVVLNGREYIVQDRGGAITEGRVDVYVDTHQEAIALGKYTTTLIVRRK